MKFQIFLALLFLSCTLNGQIKKESVLLGGQISYGKNDYGIRGLNQKYKNGTFAISVGKAYRENKVIGINIGYSPTRQYNYYDGVDTSNVFSNRYEFGVFFRDYKKLAKDLYFFSQLDGIFTTSKQTQRYKSASSDRESTQRGGSLSFTPGISYQVYKKVQFEISLPNILFMRYAVTRPLHQVAQGNSRKQEEFTFSSNFSNSSPLGYLGAGFRVIL
jgi:hypothetical protein